MGIRLTALAAKAVLIAVTGVWHSGITRCEEQIRPKAQSTLRLEAPAELDATVVTPVLDHPIRRGQNVIYCSTFQIAWNELCDRVSGDEVSVENAPRWVATLNRKMTTKADLSPESYVATVGTVEDQVTRRINRALKEKFGADAPVMDRAIEPGENLAYAYLQKVVRFTEKFDSFDMPMRFRSGDKEWVVARFGIDNSKRKTNRTVALTRRVTVYPCDTEGEYVVGLASARDHDMILVAKMAPAETLLATVDAALAVVKQSPPRTALLGEPVWIPKIHFDLERRYTEIIDKFLRNPGWEKMFFSEAVQGIRFRLDERGATVTSEAELRVKSTKVKGAAGLLFSSPFLVILCEAGHTHPYFAAWIGNGELLEQVEGLEPAPLPKSRRKRKPS